MIFDDWKIIKYLALCKYLKHLFNEVSFILFVETSQEIKFVNLIFFEKRKGL